MAISDTFQNFVWGANGQRLTPQEIARKREAAGALMQGNPAFGGQAGWAGVLGRGLEGAMAGYDERQAKAAEGANATEGQNMIARILSGNGSGQFPPAPVLSGGYGAPSKPPIQTMLETVSGNQMPWQFPVAPTQPGMASNAALPMTSPYQGDLQPPPMPVASGTLPSSGMSGFLSGGNPIASMKPGGLFGFLNPQSASGLW